MGCNSAAVVERGSPRSSSSVYIAMTPCAGRRVINCTVSAKAHSNVPHVGATLTRGRRELVPAEYTPEQLAVPGYADALRTFRRGFGRGRLVRSSSGHQPALPDLGLGRALGNPGTAKAAAGTPGDAHCVSLMRFSITGCSAPVRLIVRVTVLRRRMSDAESRQSQALGPRALRLDDTARRRTVW
jgi:hypothetical protein